MPKITFEEDPFSRRMLRLLLSIELGATVIVIGLIRIHLYSLALAISFITFFVFIFMLLWLYFRYKNIPVVREKHNLNQKAFNLQNNIQTESKKIHSAKQKQDGFVQAEQNEFNTTLLKVQQNHIQQGLASNYIKDATIPGIGPKLKERLATYNVITAANIGNNMSEIPGFGDAKRQALVGWRSSIHTTLDNTKPVTLADEQLQSIKEKYQALHSKNDIFAKNADDNKQNLINELNTLKPRLEQLAPITFIAYLSRSLASRGFVAAFIAFLLIIAQFISSVSATTSSIISSIPTATPTPTATYTPTTTFTPTVTFTSTITNTPTITYTPTITFTPTNTFTPTKTRTPIPTKTSLPTLIVAPTSSGAGSGGNAPCNCSGSDLNCSDFSSHASAQACYSYCVSQGFGDVFGLDRDGNGSACESLP